MPNGQCLSLYSAGLLVANEQKRAKEWLASLPAIAFFPSVVVLTLFFVACTHITSNLLQLKAMRFAVLH